MEIAERGGFEVLSNQAGIDPQGIRHNGGGLLLQGTLQWIAVAVVSLLAVRGL